MQFSLQTSCIVFGFLSVWHCFMTIFEGGRKIYIELVRECSRWVTTLGKTTEPTPFSRLERADSDQGWFEAFLFCLLRRQLGNGNRM